MRSRIHNIYPGSEFKTVNDTTIFVADFSERTNKVRGVEVSSVVPLSPDGSNKSMECLRVINSGELELSFNVFEDHQFKDVSNNDIEHCECCFFPNVVSEGFFVGFVEIKDCKPKKISEYKDKALNQIISSARIFRDRDIVDKSHRLYGVISFPRRKTLFDENLFSNYIDFKRVYKQEKIHVFVTNDIFVVDEKQLSVKFAK